MNKNFLYTCISNVFLGFLLCACQEKQHQEFTVKKPTANLSLLTQNKNIWPEHFSVEKLQKLMTDGDLYAASRYINAALQVSPKNPCLHLANGIVYEAMMQQGECSRRELVSIAYQTAYNIDPSQWFSAYLLGLSELKEQKYEEAQQYLANALILRPNDSDILYALAYTSYYLQDMPVAVSCIHKAIALKPKDPAIHRAAIMIFAAAGESKKAAHYAKCYESIVGAGEPDIQIVQQRLKDWHNLHANNPIYKTTGGPSDTAEGIIGSSTDDSKFKHAQSAARVKSPYEGTVVVNCFLLRNSESLTTSKGNNIMSTLSVVLGQPSDGIYFTKGRSRSGSGVVSSNWSKNLAYSILPGSVTGGALLYSLNIANVKDQTTEIIGRPSVTTLIGKVASFTQGDQYIGASGGISGASQSSINAGTDIQVTPQSVTDKGLVTLDIALSGSLFTTPPISTSSISSQLIVSTRSRLETTVKAYFGQTIVLGGIYSNSRTNQKTGFPFLQDIPLIQYFFANNTTTSDCRSVLYLLTLQRGGSIHDCVSPNRDPENQFVAVDKKLKQRGLMAIGEYPSLYYTMKFLKQSQMINQFRSGDLPKPFFGYDSMAHSDKLNQLASFLWY